ncbi:adenine-specific methyltransferase EcoRI family protein [Acidithiobacillus sp. M4-SHS-6]|uniref:adenine-specific methyltransferase EcoRI family protein n=1 Tax=Acidithiobacillus sp. M4-SHS-6 TaxID=3383024 RepID=UPI0039BDD2C8
MSDNKNLCAAIRARNDEFYTQFPDIEAEISGYIDANPNIFRGKTVLCPCDDPERSQFTQYFLLNFNRLGLIRLISTSYSGIGGNPGKCLIRMRTGHATKDFRKLLSENGDFRSKEITAFRDEADFIITNPPFSLFRDFMTWILAAPDSKHFLVIGNQNAITYRDVFPLIQRRQMRLGYTPRKRMLFRTIHEEALRDVPAIWLTNMVHSRMAKPLRLRTMDENIRSNPRIQKHKTAYMEYDNYRAIEVPFTKAIPSDYPGIMGVPISFLNHHCPEQFDILGSTESGGNVLCKEIWKTSGNPGHGRVAGITLFKRIFIRHRH